MAEWWRRRREVDDDALGAYLVTQAVTEIRSLAEAEGDKQRALPPPDEANVAVFRRIRFLANLCDNMPSCTRDVIRIRALASRAAGRKTLVDGEFDSYPEVLTHIRQLADDFLATRWSPPSAWRRRLHKASATTPRERAMAARPLAYAWHTCGPDEQDWITQHLRQAGLRWTPPPPLLRHRKGFAEQPEGNE